ncbi:hypothetical protein ACFY3U_23925 [Micromonospora sp. NPDC000089]|uniref:hypothetical protein n=1 Tax=unclassified Micromonospora TaxID=2617518 RepID=UPI0036A53B0E
MTGMTTVTTARSRWRLTFAGLTACVLATAALVVPATPASAVTATVQKDLGKVCTTATGIVEMRAEYDVVREPYEAYQRLRQVWVRSTDKSASKVSWTTTAAVNSYPEFSVGSSPDTANDGLFRVLYPEWWSGTDFGVLAGYKWFKDSEGTWGDWRTVKINADFNHDGKYDCTVDISDGARSASGFPKSESRTQANPVQCTSAVGGTCTRTHEAWESNSPDASLGSQGARQVTTVRYAPLLAGGLPPPNRPDIRIDSQSAVFDVSGARYQRMRLNETFKALDTFGVTLQVGWGPVSGTVEQGDTTASSEVRLAMTRAYPVPTNQMTRYSTISLAHGIRVARIEHVSNSTIEYASTNTTYRLSSTLDVNSRN